MKDWRKMKRDKKPHIGDVVRSFILACFNDIFPNGARISGVKKNPFNVKHWMFTIGDDTDEWYYASPQFDIKRQEAR
jgi:hypothetical protein